MQGKGFCSVRKNLGKTQKQMSELLGISLKAVQSFEQGQRLIFQQGVSRSRVPIFRVNKNKV